MGLVEVKYVGLSDVRIITKKNWEQEGVAMPQDTVWDASNRRTLLIDGTDRMLEVLKAQGHFRVSEVTDDNQNRSARPTSWWTATPGSAQSGLLTVSLSRTQRPRAAVGPRTPLVARVAGPQRAEQDRVAALRAVAHPLPARADGSALSQQTSWDC
jgi:hypothetical protein